jgi:hypothetical protein
MDFPFRNETGAHLQGFDQRNFSPSKFLSRKLVYELNGMIVVNYNDPENH